MNIMQTPVYTKWQEFHLMQSVIQAIFMNGCLHLRHSDGASMIMKIFLFMFLVINRHVIDLPQHYSKRSFILFCPSTPPLPYCCYLFLHASINKYVLLMDIC